MSKQNIKKEATLRRKLGVEDDADLAALLKVIRAIYAPVHNDYISGGGNWKWISNSPTHMTPLRNGLRAAIHLMPAAVRNHYTSQATGVLGDAHLMRDIIPFLWFVRLQDPSWAGPMSLDPNAYDPIIPIVSENRLSLIHI